MFKFKHENRIAHSFRKTILPLMVVPCSDSDQVITKRDQGNQGVYVDCSTRKLLPGGRGH